MGINELQLYTQGVNKLKCLVKFCVSTLNNASQTEKTDCTEAQKQTEICLISTIMQGVTPSSWSERGDHIYNILHCDFY